MLLVGCLGPSGHRGSSEPGTCHRDSDCGGSDLCARNAACLPPSEIRAVYVIWTLNDTMTNPTTCTSIPTFEIEFLGSADDDPLGYAPVPCAEGKFTVDKLPTSFTEVRISHRGQRQTAKIDATTGEAALDLQL